MKRKSIYNSKGSSILFAVLAMLVMSILAAVLFSTVSSDTESAAGSIQSAEAVSIAEGGIAFGARDIADDYEAAYQTTTASANGYAAVVYLEGGYNGNRTVTGGANPDRASFHKRSWNSTANRYCRLNRNQVGALTLWDFEQRRNLLGATIKRIRVIMRARAGPKQGGGPNVWPIVQMQYSINGGNTYINLGSAITMTNTSFNEFTREIVTVPADAWRFFVKENSDDLRLRVAKTNTGNREARIDWLAFELTVTVDSKHESWATGSYASAGAFPDDLGKGKITAVTITDESSKIHLNYASETLLTNLFIYAGINSVTAGTIAANIISYRGVPLASPFDSVEELMQVGGMTETIYNQVKDYITVYSWVNEEPTQPSGTRAPVNINTAEEVVLKAILKSEITNETDLQNYVDAIIARRQVLPFTHLFSSKAIQSPTRDLQSLSGWLQSLTNSDVPGVNNTERHRICNIADGSFYNRGTNTGNPDRNWRTGGDSDSSGTEFCYYTNTFMITSTGERGGIARTVQSIFGRTYSYTTYAVSTTGTYKLPAYIGGTAKGYWQETRN